MGCRSSYWRSLRELGHEGLVIEHYCYDRGVLGGQKKLWTAWHKSVKDDYSNHKDVNKSASKLWLQEWILFTGCVLHDINKSFEWAMYYSEPSKQILSDVWIATSSLRQSLNLLVRNMGLFISMRLRFSRPMTPEMKDFHRRVWGALRVRPETVQNLVDVLELRYTDGTFVICDAVRNLDAVSMIMSTFLSLWRWQTFSSGRFLGVGKATRPLTASLLTGVQALVDYILEDDPNMKHYLNGLDQGCAARAPAGRCENRYQGGVPIFIGSRHGHLRSHRDHFRRRR